MEKRIKRIGITHGDVNGVNYELILKAVSNPRLQEECVLVVYGSSKTASYYRKLLNLGEFSFNMIKDPTQAVEKRPNMINITDAEIKIDLGNSTEIAGQMAELALEMAVKDIKDGKLDAIVTAPINKHNIQSDTFHFSGHTEYLSNRFATDNTLMFMIADGLKVGVATGHIPINEVAKSLTSELILNKIRIMHKSLREDFAITKPRIAVLGLNPHAGDLGVIGNEDENVIKPAIKAAFEEDIMAFGPYPADGFFASDQFGKFDAVLAMYHDQGMIPFKILSYGEGVNFTAGLPIVRTSPAHGTAYNIAGKNIAKIESFVNAIYVASQLSQNRQQMAEAEK